MYLVGRDNTHLCTGSRVHNAVGRMGQRNTTQRRLHTFGCCSANCGHFSGALTPIPSTDQFAHLASARTHVNAVLWQVARLHRQIHERYDFLNTRHWTNERPRVFVGDHWILWNNSAEILQKPPVLVLAFYPETTRLLVLCFSDVPQNQQLQNPSATRDTPISENYSSKFLILSTVKWIF
jgi:hypothetical protein